jgi:hypothetical protein
MNYAQLFVTPLWACGLDTNFPPLKKCWTSLLYQNALLNKTTIITSMFYHTQDMLEITAMLKFPKCSLMQQVPGRAMNVKKI